jgi:hypothetical protein
VAFSVLQYAMNTTAINAVKGKGNFKSPNLNMVGDQYIQ